MFDEHALATAYRSFGADLLRQLQPARPAGNTIISPVSLGDALGLAYGAARGETAAAIGAALRLPAGLEPAQLTQATIRVRNKLAELDKELGMEVKFGRRATIPDDFKVWYQAACGLWLAQGLPINEAYLRAAEAAGMRVESVTDAEAINSWVRGQTYGQIPGAVGQVEPLSSYLVSAAYFKGGWSKLFPVADTAPAPFHLPDGTTRPVPMMALREELPYDEDERGQYIALPLGKSEMNRAESYLIIALPRPEVGLAELLAAADQRWWALRYAHLTSHLTDYKGTIRLPRFRASYEGELSDALGALGMGRALSPGADFGALTPAPTRIDAVRHSTQLAVSEEGIVAAAATAVKLLHIGIVREIPFEMTVDRPFLFAIIAVRTGAMLFMGAVSDPEPLP